jgi:hypothetical protein
MSRKKSVVEEEGEVIIEEGDVEDLVEETPAEDYVLETQDCACDHTTKASGFCPHGNNI